MAMLVSGMDTIRDVIAFPKTQKSYCPLTECPSEVDPKQLDELGIELNAATQAKKLKEKEMAENTA